LGFTEPVHPAATINPAAPATASQRTAVPFLIEVPPMDDRELPYSISLMGIEALLTAKGGGQADGQTVGKTAWFLGDLACQPPEGTTGAHRSALRCLR
jgi:hypothetical protein